jgi:hypothetical protein
LTADASSGSFAEALAGFGSLLEHVDLLSETSASDEAMLLYDLEVQGLGTLRVAEHLTVAAGKMSAFGRSTTPRPFARPASPSCPL